MRFRLITLFFVSLLPFFFLSITPTSSWIPPPPLITYPETFFGEWTHASPRDILCPPAQQGVNLTNLGTKVRTIWKQNKHHELLPVKGHLCFGVDYKVHCSEGFFGTQTVVKKISKSGVTERECRDAIDDFEKNGLVEPYFPAQECIWMRDNEVRKRFVQVRRHNVQYDPYRESFVDGLFPGQSCTSLYCPTLHENTLWIGDRIPTPYCSPFQPLSATIFGSTTTGDLYIRHSEFNTDSLKDACKMTYCGKVGVRLNNGYWFGGGDGITIPRGPCPEGTKISISGPQESIDLLTVELHLVEQRTDCLNAVQEIRTTNKTDFLTLSKLTPRYPMNHWAYRLKNNTLEKVMTKWGSISTISSTNKDNYLGHNGQKEVIWTDWVNSGREGIKSGFNGVHKLKNGKIIIPNLEMLKLEYSETLLMLHDLIPVEHPIVDVARKEGLDDDVATLTDKNTIDFGGWVSRLWSNFWGKVGMFVCIAIAVLVVLCFCRKCCKTLCCKCFGCLKSKKSRTRQSTQDMEMGLLSNSTPRPSTTPKPGQSQVFALD